MTKYRILERPQPDRSVNYGIEIETDVPVPIWGIFGITEKLYIHFLVSNFATKKEAKAYIEFLGRQPKVVFETYCN